MDTADAEVSIAGADDANAENITQDNRMIAPSRHTPA